jgi:hypothetical protein
MKVFTYTAADLGWNKLPAGRLRFDNIDVEDWIQGRVTDAELIAEQKRSDITHTRNPDEADAIVVPPGLVALREGGLYPHQLRYMNGRGHKHVFFDIKDDWTVFPEHEPKKSIFLRCNLTNAMIDVNPNSRIFNWPIQVPDWVDIAPPDLSKIAFDISFHGWRSSEVCMAVVDAVRKEFPADRLDFKEHPNFWGYMPPGKEKQEMFDAHRQSIARSLIILSPASLTQQMGAVCGYGATIRYRAYEAMCAGRVFCHVGSGHPWPRPNIIPWQDFSIRYEEKDAQRVGVWLREFVDNHSPEQILRMGTIGKLFYTGHLNPDHWPQMWRDMVKEIIGCA